MGSTAKAGYDFDSTLNSTDYYYYAQGLSTAANPDVAVGPDDIVAVVGNGYIARFQNPNAATANPAGVGTTTPATGCGWVTPGLPTAGLASVDCTQAGTNPGTIAQYGQPTSKVALTTWLGTTTLDQVCPTGASGTGTSRTTYSCVITNASVRYDQMQGRFLVLFSVVDTGQPYGGGGVAFTAGPQYQRRANWVLLVSRYAGLYLGADPNTTEVFTTPNPPNSSGSSISSSTSTGGVNTNWILYTGLSAIESDLPATISNGAFVYGNINHTVVPGFSQQRVLTPDCSTTPGTAPCYIPTDVRLGIDNDNVILTATVFNDNVALAQRTGYVFSLTLLTGGSGYTTAPTVTISGGGGSGATAHATIDTTTGQVTGLTLDTPGAGYWYTPSVTIAAPASGTTATASATIVPNNNPYVGTRLRVYKKSYIYRTTNAVLPLTPGNGVGDGTHVPPTYVDGSGNTVNDVTAGAFYDLFPMANPWALSGTDLWSGAKGLVYEPAHLRGRGLATFSGNGNLQGITELVGTLAGSNVSTSNNGGGSYWWSQYASIQAIHYTAATTFPTASLAAGIPFLPNTFWGWTGQNPAQVYVDPYSASFGVRQAPSKDKAVVSAILAVGDIRPQRVIAREGLLYDARVGLDNPVYSNLISPLAGSGATTIYDIFNVNQVNLTAGTATNPFLSYKTEWANGNFFAPMFDVPANVITYGSVSPVNVLPYFDKLFVATTYPPLTAAVSPDLRGTQNVYGTTVPVFAATTAQYDGRNYAGINNCRYQDPGLYSNMLSFPGLWDMRCGEDAFDTMIGLYNPFNGTAQNIIAYPERGGAGPDPNNLSMWYFGAYARGRSASNIGPGQWGTHLSNYLLSFPTTDPYGNATSWYTDVPNTYAYFPYIQIARQNDIVPGGRTATYFYPTSPVVRAEMAYWVVRAQMDEAAITNYLNATGGAVCHFSDVGCPNSTAVPTGAPTIACPASGTQPTGCTSATSSSWWRYIETMYRRGYTKGCNATSDGYYQFCPGNTLKRGEMAVFLIRAKMNSVFPTSVSGSNTTTGYPGPGDLYGLQFPSTAYFSDVAVPVYSTSGVLTSGDPYFWYIQKLRELRITNGSGDGSYYDTNGTLTREQIATFLVRSFFL